MKGGSGEGQTQDAVPAGLLSSLSPLQLQTSISSSEEWEPTALLTGLWLELRSNSSEPLIIWSLPDWGLGKDQGFGSQESNHLFSLTTGNPVWPVGYC